MAPAALQVVSGIGARREDGLSPEHLVSIMTGAAVEAFAICGRRDAGGLGLHGKTDIHMAEPAGELGPVKPVIEYDCTRSN
jgi:hypothetical protein